MYIHMHFKRSSSLQSIVFPRTAKVLPRLSSKEAAHRQHLISSLSLAQPTDFSTGREDRSLLCCLPTLQMYV